MSDAFHLAWLCFLSNSTLLYKPVLACVKPHKIVIKITINVGNASDVEVKCDSDGVENKPVVDVKCEPGGAENATDAARNKGADIQVTPQVQPQAPPQTQPARSTQTQTQPAMQPTLMVESAAISENAGAKVEIMDGVEQCPEIPQKDSHAMPKNDGMLSIARHIPITPLDAFILHMLHFSDRDMTADEISENVRAWFGEIKSRDIRVSLADILVESLMYVNERRVRGGDRNVMSRYTVSAKARDEYFSIPSNRQRKKIVLETMSQIVEEQRRMGRYCKYNLGNAVKHLPSLMVLEPETYQSGNDTFYSPDRWNPTTITAIDVKIDPLKHHKGQVYNNWQKNTNQNIYTFFVVFNPKHVDVIKKILIEYGADKTTYSIRAITRGMVKDNKAGDQEITQLPDHKYIPDCVPKSVLKDTPSHKPSDGPRVKNMTPVGSASDGKTANPVRAEFGGKPTAVPKAGRGPAKKKEKNTDTEPTWKLEHPYIPHMSELEYDIYNIIGAGLSVEPDDIRMRLGKKDHVSDSSIIKAVTNLREKQCVFMKQQSYGDERANNYHKKLILVKFKPGTVPDPKIGRANVVPTEKLDDTTMTKMAVYSDDALARMGPQKLIGLLRSDRTTKRQKDKIIEILTKKGPDIGHDAHPYSSDIRH